jgi:hypothetical protein
MPDFAGDLPDDQDTAPDAPPTAAVDDGWKDIGNANDGWKPVAKLTPFQVQAATRFAALQKPTPQENLTTGFGTETRAPAVPYGPQPPIPAPTLPPGYEGTDPTLGTTPQPRPPMGPPSPLQAAASQELDATAAEPDAFDIAGSAATSPFGLPPESMVPGLRAAMEANPATAGIPAAAGFVNDVLPGAAATFAASQMPPGTPPAVGQAVSQVAGNVARGAVAPLTSPAGAALGGAAAVSAPASAAIGAGIAAKSAVDLATRDMPQTIQGVMEQQIPKIVEGVSNAILDALGIAGGTVGMRSGAARVAEGAAAEAAARAPGGGGGPGGIPGPETAALPDLLAKELEAWNVEHGLAPDARGPGSALADVIEQTLHRDFVEGHLLPKDFTGDIPAEEAIDPAVLGHIEDAAEQAAGGGAAAPEAPRAPAEEPPGAEGGTELQGERQVKTLTEEAPPGTLDKILETETQEAPNGLENRGQDAGDVPAEHEINDGHLAAVERLAAEATAAAGGAGQAPEGGGHGAPGHAADAAALRGLGAPLGAGGEAIGPAVAPAAGAGEAAEPAAGEREADATARGVETDGAVPAEKVKGPTPLHVLLRGTLPKDLRAGRIPDEVIDRVEAIDTLEEANATQAKVMAAWKDAKARAAAKEKGALAESRDLGALMALVGMKAAMLSPSGRLGAKYGYQTAVGKLRAINSDEAVYKGIPQPTEGEGQDLAPVAKQPSARDEFEAKMRARFAETDAREKAIKAAVDTSPSIRLKKAGDDNRTRVLSRGTDPRQAPWRVTAFEGDEPTGHIEYHQRSAAIQELAANGYEPVEAGARAPAVKPKSPAVPSHLSETPEETFAGQPGWESAAPELDTAPVLEALRAAGVPDADAGPMAEGLRDAALEWEQNGRGTAAAFMEKMVAEFKRRAAAGVSAERAAYGWQPGDALPETLADATKGRKYLGLPKGPGTYPLRGGGHIDTKTLEITTPKGERLEPGSAAHDWAFRNGFEGDWQTVLERKRGAPGEVGEAKLAYGEPTRDENFRRWFEGSQVTNEDGTPKVVYHATRSAAPFTEFDTEGARHPDLGAHFGTAEAANDRINMSPADLEKRENIGLLHPGPFEIGRRLYPVYLSIKNPLRLPDLGTWAHPDDWIENLPRVSPSYTNDELDDELWATADRWRKSFRNEANPDSVDTLSDEFAKAMKRVIERHGYDGIVYVNEAEAKAQEQDSYIAFHPNQIKSATGNSGAFDPANPSIVGAKKTPYQEGLGLGSKQPRYRDQPNLLGMDEDGQPDLFSADESATPTVRGPEGAAEAGRRPSGPDETDVRGIEVVGDRIAQELRDRGHVSLVGQEAPTLHALAAVAQAAADSRFETLRFPIVSAAGRVIEEPAWTAQLPSTAWAWGSHQELNDFIEHVQSVLALNEGAKIYALHNHPTGSPVPSTDDKRITRNLADMFGAKFAGHVVIDHEHYGTITPSGDAELHRLTPEQIAARPKILKPADPATGIGMPAQTQREVALLGKALALDGITVVLANATPAEGGVGGRLHSRAVLRVPRETFNDIPWMATYLRAQMGKYGAVHAIAYAKESDAWTDDAATVLYQHNALSDLVTGEPGAWDSVRARARAGGVKQEGGEDWPAGLSPHGDRPAASRVGEDKAEFEDAKGRREWAENADRVERMIDAGKIDEVSDRDLRRAWNFVESRIRHEQHKGWGPNPQPVNEDLVRSLQASADFFRITERERGTIVSEDDAPEFGEDDELAFARRFLGDRYAKHLGGEPETLYESRGGQFRGSGNRFAEAARRLAMGGEPVASRTRAKPVPAGSGLRLAPKSEFRQGLEDAKKDLIGALLPASVNDRAAAGSDVLRYREAERIETQQQTEHRLRQWRGRLDRLSFPTGHEVVKIARLPEAEREKALLKFDGIRFLDSVETWKPPKEMKRAPVGDAFDTAEDAAGMMADALGSEPEGRPYDSPELEAIGNVLHDVLNEAKRRVQGLGTGKLSKAIELYYPHIWENVVRAQEFVATFAKQKAMEGNKSWMKKRKYPTMLLGMQSGLIPAFRNPLDQVLAHTHQLGKFVMAHQALDDLGQLGLNRPFDIDTNVPLGWEALDPRIGQIWGPREIPVEETVDALMWQKLQDFAAEHGIKVGREVGLGGPIGLSSPLTHATLTKFGSPMSVLVHEIGHSIDSKYKVWEKLFFKGEGEKLAEKLVKEWNRNAPRTKAEREGRARARRELKQWAEKRETMRKELRALADLRFEGDEDEAARPVAQRGGFGQYVRERPEQIANLFDAYVSHRERLADVAPHVFKALEELLEKNGMSDFKDIRPSLVIERRTDTVPLQGKNLLGYYAAPKEVARVLNRFLSPGLQNKALYKGTRFFFNALNQAQLGLSAFHLVFTGLDTMVSRGSLGTYQLMNGVSPIEGIWKMLSAPAAPVLGLVKGQRMMEAAGLTKNLLGTTFAGPLADDIRAVVQAGGRFKQDAAWTAAAKGKWISSLRAAWGELQHARPGAAAKLGYSALWRTPFAAIEAVSAPIMEWWVPRLKLATFADMAHVELERLGPEATRAEIRRALARAWDSVDNRMGQLAYSNLFWNAAAKDALLVAVRSAGWNIGFLREGLGGIKDFLTIPSRLGAPRGPRKLGPERPAGGAGGGEPPERPREGWEGVEGPWEGEPGAPPPRQADLRDPWFTHRMAYLVYGTLFMGLAGSTLQFMMTGELPKSLKDAYFPRTGGRNKDGSAERISLPSYVKDAVAWWRDWARTAWSKVNPGASALWEFHENKQFPNTRIYNEKDPLLQKGMDVLDWLAKTSTPMSLKGPDKPNPRSALPKWAGTLGLKPAPRYITNPAAEEAQKAKPQMPPKRKINAHLLGIGRP